MIAAQYVGTVPSWLLSGTMLQLNIKTGFAVYLRARWLKVLTASWRMSERCANLKNRRVLHRN